MITNILFLSGGAICGALLRWCFVLLFNPIYPSLPIGTLLANLLGGFLVGLVMEGPKYGFILSEPLRLAIFTGFLGALTTFSSFSAEAVNLFQRSEYSLACLLISLHLLGGLALTFFGVFSAKYIMAG